MTCTVNDVRGMKRRESNKTRIKMADIESEEFNDTCVRGFHVYKDVWRPVIGEELRCQREEDNPRDPYPCPLAGKSGFSRLPEVKL